MVHNERYNTTDPIALEAIQQLSSEIISQSEPGPNVEAPTAAMFASVWRRLPESESLQYLVGEAAARMQRMQIATGSTVSGLRTSLVNYFRSYALETKNIDFSDAELTTVSSWQPYFDNLEADFTTVSTQAMQYLRFSSIHLNAVTPVKERYLMPEIYVRLVKDRFPGGARVLDYGSSTMLGALSLLHKDAYPVTDFIDVIYEPEADSSVNLTSKTNQLKNGQPAIKSIDCVDAFPVFNEKTGRYDRSFANQALSALRPSERANHEYFEGLQALMALKETNSPDFRPDNGVTFHWADFLDPILLERFKSKSPELFDVVVANYVTQELSRPQRRLLHQALGSLVHDGGLIIYTHQAHISKRFSQPASISAVRLHASYASRPWGIESHVQDNLHPGRRGLQHMASFYDNRCRIARLGMGELVVNGETEKIGDLIRDA